MKSLPDLYFEVSLVGCTSPKKSLDGFAESQEAPVRLKVMTGSGEALPGIPTQVLLAFEITFENNLFPPIQEIGRKNAGD